MSTILEKNDSGEDSDSETSCMYTEDIWKLYFHDPIDTNWLHESYKVVTQISTANDFNGVHTALKDIVHNGMFFLMREHIFPAWDDHSNISGGCICIKIPKSDVEPFWKGMCASLIGETIVKKEFIHLNCKVNGVSISPKNFFCIVKLWLSTNCFEKYAPHCFDLPDFDGQVIYKANHEESQRFAVERSQENPKEKQTTIRKKIYVQ